MFLISSIGKRLREKLKKRGYRSAYVAEHVRRGLAHQIRALRDQRFWNQGKLAEKLGKPQSVVSRLEDPSYGKLTIQTLLEVANAFDVALQVKFMSYSSFLQNTRDLSAASMQVPGFSDDMNETGFVRQRGSMMVTATSHSKSVQIAFVDENKAASYFSGGDGDSSIVRDALSPVLARGAGVMNYVN